MGMVYLPGRIDKGEDKRTQREQEGDGEEEQYEKIGSQHERINKSVKCAYPVSQREFTD
jgi:hypothetical protein